MPHIHDKIDFTVEVFIVCSGKVLLRLHDKYNIWLSVGGHVELDEEPNQAALREVKEETGLDVVLYDRNRPFVKKTEDYEELISPYFMNIHAINETHKHIGMVYFAESKSMEVVPENESDSSDNWKWLTKEELENMQDLEGHIRFYALKALEILSNKS